MHMLLSNSNSLLLNVSAKLIMVKERGLKEGMSPFEKG